MHRTENLHDPAKVVDKHTRTRINTPVSVKQAKDLDFWNTQPATVSAKRAPKPKRSAAKSKADSSKPAAAPQSSNELPSGSEGAAAASNEDELLAYVAGLPDKHDDELPSLPSPAESLPESAIESGRPKPLKRPAAASSGGPKMKRPAAAFVKQRPAASVSADPVAAPAAAAAADQEAEKTERTLKVRGNLKVVLPPGVTLGCPKCRDSKVGCGTCRRAKGFTLIGGSLAMFYFEGKILFDLQLN